MRAGPAIDHTGACDNHLGGFAPSGIISAQCPFPLPWIRLYPYMKFQLRALATRISSLKSLAPKSARGMQT